MSYSELSVVFEMHRFPLRVTKDRSGESQFKQGNLTKAWEKRGERHKTHRKNLTCKLSKSEDNSRKQHTHTRTHLNTHMHRHTYTQIKCPPTNQ